MVNHNADDARKFDAQIAWLDRACILIAIVGTSIVVPLLFGL